VTRREIVRRARQIAQLRAQIASSRAALLAAVAGGAASVDPRVARALANALVHAERARELLVGKDGAR
jgi:hypothetical protein